MENRRRQAEIKPDVRVKTFHSTHQALLSAPEFDLLVIDGAPHATQGTLEAARHSDVVIIPTGSSVDDLEPGVLLANELTKTLKSDSIFLRCAGQPAPARRKDARETLKGQGFDALAGCIPMKTGYITALGSGRCLTETPYPALNQHAMQVINSLAARVTE